MTFAYLSRFLKLFFRLSEKNRDVFEGCELVVCSPLSRAMQTGLGITKNYMNLPVIAHPGLREVGKSSCDIGREVDDLRADFPRVDFDLVPRGNWWYLKGLFFVFLCVCGFPTSFRSGCGVPDGNRGPPAHGEGPQRAPQRLGYDSGQPIFFLVDLGSSAPLRPVPGRFLSGLFFFLSLFFYQWKYRACLC